MSTQSLTAHVNITLAYKFALKVTEEKRINFFCCFLGYLKSIKVKLNNYTRVPTYKILLLLCQEMLSAPTCSYRVHVYIWYEIRLEITADMLAHIYADINEEI